MSLIPMFPALVAPEQSIRDTSGYAATSNNTTHSVPLPSYVAGDMLLMLICIGGDLGAPTVTGWTPVANASSGTGSADRALYVFKKVADTGTAQDVLIGGNSTISAQVYAITDANTIESDTVSGVSATPNPPSVTPTWSQRPYMSIAALATRSATATPPADSYTGITNQSSTSNGTKTTASGWRFRPNSTFTNPDAFGTANENYAAATILITYV